MDFQMVLKDYKREINFIEDYKLLKEIKDLEQKPIGVEKKAWRKGINRQEPHEHSSFSFSSFPNLYSYPYSIGIPHLYPSLLLIFFLC